MDNVLNNILTSLHPNSSLNDNQSELYLDRHSDHQVNEDYWPSEPTDINRETIVRDQEETIRTSLSETGRPSPKMSDLPCFSYRSNIGRRW